MHVTAIIPAKGTSARLPGKNLADFCGLSLLGHKIDQLRQCASIDEVVVGSDSDEVLAIAALHGAETRKQDGYHSNDDCPLRERWRNLIAMVETDLVVWAHCTNPLCPPGAYDRAIECYLGGQGVHDSLCSVTKIQRHAWRAGRPVNFNPWKAPHPFASTLEPFYFQDGAIFIQPHEQMLKNGYFYGERPLLFELEQPQGWDIDTESDLAVARGFYSAMREGEPCLK